MAEEIRQVLGFDASQAISELRKFDQQLKTTQGAIGGFARKLNSFNRQAGKAVAILKRFADEARRLNKELSGGFAKVQTTVPSGRTGGGQVQIEGIVNLGKNAKTAQKNLEAVGRAGQNMGNQVAQGANRANQAAQGLTVSFGTIARIISTQVIVRAFGAIQRSLVEATEAAFEFQTTVAEIATIDPRGGAGFGDISGEVRALSDAFNADLGDVGRGLYQTISNQIARVGTASERAATNYEFLTTAIQLSRAGVATVEQSVNLLSGTINAFGRDAGDAARIAGQFFRVVELGRTTIRELATSFNTVAPLASELGISIEELGAAFATITIGGVDTAKAATQIRGAMNALLKPTTEMKQAFEALGVTTGEDLIELFGFQGALQAVIGTTDGTSQSIAKLIPRVRGLTGVLRLVGSGAENFQQNLQKIIETNRDLLDEKFDIVATTNAFEVQRELNQLRNFLIDDFGNSVIRVTKSILDFAGGMDNVLQALQALGTGLKTVGPVFLLTAGAIAAIGIQSKIASAQVGVLGKALAAVAAVGLAVSAGQFIGQQIKDFQNAARDARTAAAEATVADISKRAQAERDIEAATNQQILAGVKNRFAEISKLNSARIREAREAAAAEVRANKDAFEALLGASQTLEKQLRSQFESRESQAREAVQNMQGFEQDLRDERFDQRTKDFDDAKKFSALERKLAQDRAIALSQINRQALDAGDPEQLQQIRDVFQQALADARQLQGAAGDDPRRQQRANRAVIQALQARIGLERQLLRIIATRQAREKAAADAVAKNNQLLKDSFASLIESQEGVFEAGISDEERNRRFDRFSQERLKFFEILRKNAQIGARELADFGRAFGDRGLVGIIQRDLTRFQIEQIDVSDTSLREAQQKINDAIQGGVEAIDVEIRIALEGAGIDVGSQKQALSEVEKAIQADETIKAAENQIEEVNNRIQARLEILPSLQAEIAKRVGRREESLRSVEEIGGKAATADQARAIARLQILLAQVAEDGRVTAEELSKVETSLVNAQNTFAAFKRLGGQTRLNIAFSQDLQVVSTLTGLVRGLRTETEKLEEAERKLKTAREGSTLDPTQRQNIIDAGKTVAERQREQQEAQNQTNQEIDQSGQAGLNAANNLDAMTSSIQNTRSEVQRLQGDLNSLQPPDVQPALAAKGGLIQGFAKGGLVKYLDRGGFIPRGTDTIPAMLSPGEYVVNARSARMFYSQLQAINAGVRPVYRQDGGPVNNTTIGDVNVTVQPGRSNESTGREIGRSLRRELRRNTSTL